ncbi:predicted protein [Naegleria gruberi]|uniref:Predicted protein n=1 Tax=Naegleria gruberi TaxID=5762 RepID=D2V2B0_NAEGR|nr:uncharacterized protein NAEGRDRAFT_46124 [Naegleria gruberi]EFC49025.1 predicted protein [Naegleria gruberi]|eukprot:XP_002681769.1 predicted protein [Naegleria gruberi strain NEG-M]
MNNTPIDVQSFTQLHTRLENYYSLGKGQGLEMIPFMDRLNPLLASDKRITRIECLKILNRDYHKLLTCNDHDFWVLMLNDTSLKRSLESVFRLFPRPFDIGFNQINENCPRNEQREEIKIYRRLFMIYYRLFMNFNLHGKGNIDISHPTDLNNVNREEWLDAGFVICEKHLLDVGKIFDLSSLYGYPNSMLTTELLSRIFLSSPNYMHELNEHVLNSICVTWRDLFDASNKVTSNSKSDCHQIRKLIYYLYDSTFTIRSLLDVFPLASYAFMVDTRETKTPVNYQFPNLLMECHDKIIPQLLSIIGDDPDYRFVCRQVKLNIVSILHVLFREYYMRNIEDLITGETHSNRSTTSHMETLYTRYFESSFKKEQIPKSKLELLCKFTLDKQLTRQATGIVLELLDILQGFFKFQAKDQTKFNYVIYQYDKLYGLGKWLEQVILGNALLSSVSSVYNISTTIFTKLSENAQTEGSTNSEDEPALTEMLKQLKSFFPDYGNGFLQACLDHFNNDITNTTNALMDNQLPLHLKKMDNKLSLKSYKAPTNTGSKPPSSLLNTGSTSGSSSSSYEPASPIVSPTVWMDTDFFASVRIGKKKDNRTNFNETDETIKQRILLEYAYDDEYDDSYDSVMAVTTEGEHEDENFNKIKVPKAYNSNPNHQHHHGEEKPQTIENKPPQQQQQQQENKQQQGNKQQGNPNRNKHHQQQSNNNNQSASTPNTSQSSSNNANAAGIESNSKPQRNQNNNNNRGGSTANRGKRGGGYHQVSTHQQSKQQSADTSNQGSNDASKQVSKQPTATATNKVVTNSATTSQDNNSDTTSSPNEQQRGGNNNNFKQKGENKAKSANHDRRKKADKKRMVLNLQ